MEKVGGDGGRIGAGLTMENGKEGRASREFERERSNSHGRSGGRRTFIFLNKLTVSTDHIWQV